MALPAVSVTLANGRLGRVNLPADRVVGLILDHTTPTLPQVLFQPSDISLLIPVFDPTDVYSAEVKRQIDAFYRVAGNGAELWVMLVAPNVSTTLLYTNGTAQKLIDAADGRIHVLGQSRLSLTTLVTGIEADVAAGLVDVHAFAVACASRHTPIRVLLSAGQYDGVAATVLNLRELAFSRVGVCLSQSSATVSFAPMGLLLGRVASVAPNRNIGAVADGPQTDTAFLPGNPTTGTLGMLYDKGYILLRKHIGRGGYYWAGDPMATLPTDDYAFLSDGRVIDKVHRIAYGVFLNELLATVAVNPQTGKIIKATLKRYQADIERAVSIGMGEEISGVVAFVDPLQDVLATSTLNVDLRVIPTGTNRTINIKLGFTNPSLV